MVSIFRLVKNLSEHEYAELEEDFDIHLDGKHVIAALTREQWILLVGENVDRQSEHDTVVRCDKK